MFGGKFPRQSRLPKSSKDPTHPYPIKDPTRHDPFKIITKRKDVFTQKNVEPTTEKKKQLFPKKRLSQKNWKKDYKKQNNKLKGYKKNNKKTASPQKKHQDSLTLLHVLLELQRRSPVKFTVSAATVNPETPEFSPEPLIVPWIHQGLSRKDQLTRCES